MNSGVDDAMSERQSGRINRDNFAKIRCDFGILSMVAALTVFYFLSQYNYLLFHSIIEIFSIVISFSIFAIAWNRRHVMDNNFLLFIGIAFFFVGSVDILHTLVYKGMNVFPGIGSNWATQFWIAMRYMLSLSFLAALLFARRKLRPNLVFACYTVISAVLLGLIFTGIFPPAYVDGVGLTTFKVASEYVVSFILLGAIVLLIKGRREFSGSVVKLVVAAMAMIIAAEMAFTLYTDVYGIFNMAGHLLNFAAFYLIYKALVETGLSKPYDLLFHNLKQSEMDLKEQASALKTALDESKQREREISALREATGAVASNVKNLNFRDSARVIFDSCKQIIGASIGYVALLCENGIKDEVLFFDSGGFPCSVDTSLPMPIHGLRAEVYRTGIAVYRNDFPSSEWSSFMPRGSISLKNALFTPLMVDGKAVGLVGFANKEGSFSENDVRLTSAFGELMAVAFRNSQLEAQRSRLEKLAAIGETAAWVGHDLRNPLQAIKSAAYVLKQIMAQDPNAKNVSTIDKAKKMLGIIDISVDYADNIVFDLREFADDEKTLHKQTNMNTLIDETLQNMKIPDNVTVNKQFKQVPSIDADTNQIKRAFQKIVENAVQAMPNGGTLTVSSGKKGAFIEVAFKDAGIGISKENIKKIFTPFYTTKAQGMGLGLAICKKFVEAHDGTITVESKEGEGTAVIVRLPLNGGVNAKTRRTSPES